MLIALQSFIIIELAWACSSAGRAPALQAGGQGFESPHVHQLNLVRPGGMGTLRTGHMGDTFGPKGFSSGSNTRASRSHIHLRCFLFCTVLVQIRDIRDNRAFWKTEAIPHSLSLIRANL